MRRSRAASPAPPICSPAEHWGRAPLLTRAAELAATLRRPARRCGGRRTGLRPRPAHAVPADGQGRLGAAAATRFTRGGGAGAGIADQVGRRQGAGHDGRRRHARAAGPAPHLAAAGRLRPPAGRPSSATPSRSTPTSPRRRTRASRRTTTSTTCSCCRSPGASSGRSTSRSSATPLDDQPWEQLRDRGGRAGREAPLIDTVLEPGDALYLPRGTIHAARRWARRRSI